jgi:hypothetical protein
MMFRPPSGNLLLHHTCSIVVNTQVGTYPCCNDSSVCFAILSLTSYCASLVKRKFVVCSVARVA